MDGQRGLALRTRELMHELRADELPANPSARPKASSDGDLPAALCRPNRLDPEHVDGRIRALWLSGRRIVRELNDVAALLGGNAESDSAPAAAYRRTLMMTKAAFRALQSISENKFENGDYFDSLQVLFDEITERVTELRIWEERRHKEIGNVEILADWLSGLVNNRPVIWKPIADLSELIWADASKDIPLRFPIGKMGDASHGPDQRAAMHCLAVASVIARVTKRRTEFRNRPLDPILAALVFDAGMAVVPEDVTSISGPLDPEQRKQIEAHAGHSAEAIKRLLPSEGWLYDAVLAHHERLDGSGYPAGLKGVQIPRLARLLAVCDVYTALSCRRPWRIPFSSRSALTETLLEAERGRLDVEYAEYLLDLTFYPVGTVVEMADGSIGIVVKAEGTNGDFESLSRPVVQLLLDEKGKPPEWPVLFNLSRREGRPIVRSLTGEECQEALGRRYWQLL